MSRTEQGRAARKQGVADEPAPHRSSKDTKRWCLGRVGREHEPKWIPSKHERVGRSVRSTQWLDYRCEKCAKELDLCWPWHVPQNGSRVGRNGCPRGCSRKHRAMPPTATAAPAKEPR